MDFPLTSLPGLEGINRAIRYIDFCAAPYRPAMAELEEAGFKENARRRQEQSHVFANAFPCLLTNILVGNTFRATHPRGVLRELLRAVPEAVPRSLMDKPSVTRMPAEHLRVGRKPFTDRSALSKFK